MVSKKIILNCDHFEFGRTGLVGICIPKTLVKGSKTQHAMNHLTPRQTTIMITLCLNSYLHYNFPILIFILFCLVVGFRYVVLRFEILKMRLVLGFRYVVLLWNGQIISLAFNAFIQSFWFCVLRRRD